MTRTGGVNNTGMITKSSLLGSVLAGLFLSVFPIMAQTTTVFAQQSFSTGMVPLAVGQTVQLNVLNLGAATCFVQASFFDAANKAVGTASGILAVSAGQAQSWDVAQIATPTATTSSRPHVRGVVKTEPGPTGAAISTVPVAPCTLLITMETYNASSTETLVFTSDTQPVPVVTATPAAVIK